MVSQILAPKSNLSVVELNLSVRHFYTYSNIFLYISALLKYFDVIYLILWIVCVWYVW